MASKKYKWLKWVLGITFTPLLLILLLIVLLYLPPVQNWMRGGAETLLSNALEMQVSIRRVDLRFPLNLVVGGMRAIHTVKTPQGTVVGDTVFDLDRLNLQVQALPLLKGKIEVDDITFEKGRVNTSNLVDGIRVKGYVDRLELESHGIDLHTEAARINKVDLSQSQLYISLADTVQDTDTTSTPFPWKFSIQHIRLDRVGIRYEMPLDTLSVVAQLSDARAEEVSIDLKRDFYGLETLRLTDCSLKYDAALGKPAAGFDASHIHCREVSLQVDSVMYYGEHVSGVVQECQLIERSGLSIRSLQGRVFADAHRFVIPHLVLRTPHSEVVFDGKTDWRFIRQPAEGDLTARLDAYIGKQDVLLFAGNLPQAFKEAYPFRALDIHTALNGNFTQLQVTRLRADLPGALSLQGNGQFFHLNDSVNRLGQLDLKGTTGNLNFLTTLTGNRMDGSLVIPDSILLEGRLLLDGPEIKAGLSLDERGGLVQLAGNYHTTDGTYEADLIVDSLQVDHFLPLDSIYGVTAKAAVKGKGFDFYSARTTATLSAEIDKLRYKHLNVSGISLNGNLRNRLLSADVVSDNELVALKGKGSVSMDMRRLMGNVDLDVTQIDLYRLGFSSAPLTLPFAFHLKGEAARDSVSAALTAGDLCVNLHGAGSLNEMLNKGTSFQKLLKEQWKNKQLDHVALRRALPTLTLRMRGSNANPLNDYLTTENISFNSVWVDYVINPHVGINGDAFLKGLMVDSISLDSTYLVVRQDTSKLSLKGGVVNGPRNPQYVFNASMAGEIRTRDAAVELGFKDKKGDTGLNIGLNIRPLDGEEMNQAEGLSFYITPEEPILAFRKFKFKDRSNWFYIRDDKRVFADIDMEGSDGLAISVQSDREDETSLQNLNVMLQRLNLGGLSALLPYYPDISGLASLDAKFIQTTENIQASVEAVVDEFCYENRRVGDVGLGVTWLPGEGNLHYVDSYLSCDDQEAAVVNGSLRVGEKQQVLDLNGDFEAFPLKMLNAFIPDQMFTLNGNLIGNVNLTGTTDRPVVDGVVRMDSVYAFMEQAGKYRYRFDSRPVEIKNSRLTFSNFAIYTTGVNPLTIDGVVDFRNLNRPTANLDLAANNYTLLDVPKVKGSLYYGKVFVDLDARIRGPLDGLRMRGSMNVLGNTNATYVMADTPLAVEDRMDGLVTFTSFNDTLTTDEIPSLSLGGMDMLFSIHIDDAVRLRADLSADRSKYIELAGGGDLNLFYSPQGDMSLTGRYTMTGGTMKYSLPVIPLKEFTITNGSYVDWRGDIMNPRLNLKATEVVNSTVSEESVSGNAGSRRVEFNVSISILGQLNSPELVFDLQAPKDDEIQNELLSMGAEERSKQAITMLATGMYLSGTTGGNLTMGSALNSVLQGQINSLVGSVMKDASFSMDFGNSYNATTGTTETDYSFRYSQRFFNDRVQVNIGGKVSTGNHAEAHNQSFIDDVSLEYRLDAAGSRYIRAFYNTNYEDVLDGVITETGIGYVIRKKMDRLSEVFLFLKKNPKKPVVDAKAPDDERNREAVKGKNEDENEDPSANAPTNE